MHEAVHKKRQRERRKVDSPDLDSECSSSPKCKFTPAFTHSLHDTIIMTHGTTIPELVSVLLADNSSGSMGSDGMLHL